MTLRLWHGENNESWRECLSSLADKHSLTDYDHQVLADELRRDVTSQLFDADIDYETAYQQSVGAYVILQRGGTAEERSAFDDAFDAAMERISKEAAEC